MVVQSTRVSFSLCARLFVLILDYVFFFFFFFHFVSKRSLRFRLLLLLLFFFNIFKYIFFISCCGAEWQSGWNWTRKKGLRRRKDDDDGGGRRGAAENQHSTFSSLVPLCTTAVCVCVYVVTVCTRAGPPLSIMPVASSSFEPHFRATSTPFLFLLFFWNLILVQCETLLTGFGAL